MNYKVTSAWVRDGFIFVEMYTSPVPFKRIVKKFKDK